MDEPAPTLAPAPASFEQALLPHRDAAYNLARWLMRHEQDAEDCVQESYLNAYRAFARFRGEDGRAWLLTIVRNTCYSRLRQQRRAEPAASFDEMLHVQPLEAPEGPSPWQHALARELLPRALERLPVEGREVLILHEIEGLAYREIAAVTALPVGTVMSRLSRARLKLQGELQQLIQEESHGL
jgi:RNA polymerase sigma-70 factor (ECF subfamily)